MINPYKSKTVKFILGLIFIVLIYSAYYLYFNDIFYHETSRRTKHIGTFVTTIIIYFVGTFHLGKLNDSWMSKIWHAVHISGLIILTTFGAYDWLISELPLNLRSFARSIQEMLVSPVLYVGMGVLNRSLNKQN